MINNQTPITTPKTPTPTTEPKAQPVSAKLKKPASKQKIRYILGAILLTILMVGLGATYWLTQQSQDIRQQASGPPPYYTGGDLCVDSGGSWVGDICYMGGTATCDGPGEGGGDPCAANGGYCSGTDIIRCDCGNGNWVGGKASAGCASLCGDIGLDCGGPCDNEDPPPPTNPPPTNPPPTNPPSPVPSPSPTPPGPQCLNITMDNPSPGLGDQVVFTCGEVSGADHYVFRIMYPDGISSSLSSTGRVSEPVIVSQSGQYQAQCQICTGPAASSCHPWEPLL